MNENAETREPLGWVIRVGLVAVLAFAPLAFGAVHPWAYGIVWGALWFLVLFWGIKAWILRRKATSEWEIQWVKAWFQPCLVLFGLWVIIQCIPIPSAIVGLAQPDTLDAYRLAEPFVGNMPKLLTLSLYPHATRLWTFHLWSCAAVFYLTLYHFRTKKLVFAMAVLLVALGAFEAIYGLMEHLGGTHRIWWWEIPESGGVRGTFINRNHLAGYLEMTILVALGLLLALRGHRVETSHLGWRGRLAMLARDDRWTKAIPVAFACIVMGAALVLSLSRGALIALVIVLLPLGVLLLLKRGMRLYGLIILTFFLGIFLYATPLGMESAIERFGQLPQDMEGRQTLWMNAWDMVRSFPLAGIGLGTFEWVYPLFKGERFGAGLLTHAHNEWLEILVETGLIGLVLVILGLSFYLLAGIRDWGRRRDRWAISLGFSALAVVLVQAAYGFVEFHLRTHAVSLTLAGIMAWGWVLIHLHRRMPPRETLRWAMRTVTVPAWMGRWGMLFLLCIHIVVGAGMTLHYWAEALVPTVRNSTVVRAEVRDLELLRRAIDLEPANAKRWAWMAREVVRQGIPERLRVWARKKGLEPYEHRDDAASWAVAFLQRALRLNPTCASHYEQLGWVLASRAYWRESGLAEEALRASVQLEPAHPLRHFRVGQYLLMESRPEEADEAFQEAVRLAPKLQSHVDEEWKIFSQGRAD